MTIIKNEVKTISTIKFNAIELGDVITEYKNREALRIFYPKAFDFVNMEDLTVGALINVLKNLGHNGNADTYKVIADHFGFDGWENAGHYNKHDKGHTYTMVVFSYGDTVN